MDYVIATNFDDVINSSEAITFLMDFFRYENKYSLDKRQKAKLKQYNVIFKNLISSTTAEDFFENFKKLHKASLSVLLGPSREDPQFEFYCRKSLTSITQYESTYFYLSYVNYMKKFDYNNTFSIYRLNDDEVLSYILKRYDNATNTEIFLLKENNINYLFVVSHRCTKLDNSPFEEGTKVIKELLN